MRYYYYRNSYSYYRGDAGDRTGGFDNRCYRYCFVGFGKTAAVASRSPIVKL